MKTSPLNPTEFQLDALREYIGIGVGKAAATLNSLIGRHIELKVPEISIKYPEQLKSGQSDDHDLFSFVTLGFEGNLNGNASMAFDRDSAKRLVSLLLPETEIVDTEMDAMSESTLTEVGNIVINSVMGSLSNCFSFDLNYFVPRYHEDLEGTLNESKVGETALIIGETILTVENCQIEGNIIIMFLVSDLKVLLDTWSEPSDIKYA